MTIPSTVMIKINFFSHAVRYLKCTLLCFSWYRSKWIN